MLKVKMPLNWHVILVAYTFWHDPQIRCESELCDLNKAKENVLKG